MMMQIGLAHKCLHAFANLEISYRLQMIMVIDSVELYTLGGMKMLETIAVILVILWLLGLVSSYTMGGLIHILLVVAIVLILVRMIQYRRL
jgi:hypothetical protein